jgi:antitoxin VapB
MEHPMRTAKIFTTGRSQAVRLPAEFRFDTCEVYIRRDPETGDVVLSRRPDDWHEFFALADAADIPDDLLVERGDIVPAPRPALDAVFVDEKKP